jgi:hypothetical protein
MKKRKEIGKEGEKERKKEGRVISAGVEEEGRSHLGKYQDTEEQGKEKACVYFSLNEMEVCRCGQQQQCKATIDIACVQ